MSHPVSAVVKCDGASFELRFDACRLFLGGEFAGNVEVDLGCDAGVVGTVMDCLRIQVPGGPQSDVALGSGSYESGASLVFSAPSFGRLAELPSEVTLLWGETAIASLAPTLEDSVPIEQVAFTEPSEISTNLPVVSSNLVRLAANREKWWALVTALLVPLGALVGSSFPGLELPDPMLNWALGAAMIGAGLWAGAFGVGLPYRQVWLDRDRRRVLVVGGRTRSPEAQLAEASGRSLDDFDHVRLYQRWQIAEGADEHDQEVWFVTLEAPIHFASGDGTVHLREEALRLDSFASEIPARRLAAQVGLHTGLKILDTGHDKTA